MKTKHIPTALDLTVEQKLECLKDHYSKLQPTLDVVRDAVVAVAYAFKSISEIGTSNSSYWVDKFLGDLHLGPGYSWCMAFIQFVFKTVSGFWNHSDLLPRDTAGTQDLARWAEENLLVVTNASEVEIGDICIYTDGWNPGHGHCGINEIVGDAGYTLINGNTNDAFVSEGNCVAVTDVKWTKYLWKKSKTKRYLRCFISFRKLYKAYWITQAA